MNRQFEERPSNFVPSEKDERESTGTNSGESRVAAGGNPQNRNGYASNGQPYAGAAPQMPPRVPPCPNGQPYAGAAPQMPPQVPPYPNGQPYAGVAPQMPPRVPPYPNGQPYAGVAPQMPPPTGQPMPPPYRAPIYCPPIPPKPQMRPMALIGELICLALGILCFFALYYAPAVEVLGIVFGLAGLVVLFVTHRREERFSGCGIAGLMISVISSGLLLYDLLQCLIR